ncbi:hypothetical protein BDY19DRAFT_909395 [Irpex rosettiformis]|uniref:Uncharacterized protein n=1 Tax=Irpex rosettiformis TaxID=378272 RepID=A0ACB8TSI5_9APHY|nr:hypothetical protein BDY19DRAFT_909395 [Irpex rosettiformis]
MPLTETLPADLTIYILSFLSFADIVTLSVLARSYHHFIQNHEDALYHQLAVSHRYAKKGKSLEGLKGEKGVVRVDGAVQTWKEFCRASHILTMNWTGRRSACVGGYTSLDGWNLDDGSYEVQEFAIDEEHGLLLALIGSAANATGPGKVLVASTLDGEKVVWTLSDVSRFAHSGSFLLVWRSPDITCNIEIWGYASPPPPLNADDSSKPTSSPGTFVLHAIIPTPPGGWRTFAFHAPLVALVNRDQWHLVHLFDFSSSLAITDERTTTSTNGNSPIKLQTAQLIDLDPLLISNSSAPDPNERHSLIRSVLLDLQLSAKYLCACFDSAMVVVRLRRSTLADGGLVVGGKDVQVRRDVVMVEDTRHPEDGRRTWPAAKRVLRPGSYAAPGSASSESNLRSGGVGTTEYVKSMVTTGAEVVEEYRVELLTKTELEEEKWANSGANVREGYRSPWYNPNFISAQFSPNGKHLVVGTTYRYVCLFTDIDRMFDAGVKPQEIMQKMALEEPVRFIKWSGHERAIVLRDDENDTYHSNATSEEEERDGDEPTLRLEGARVLRVTAFERPRVHIHGSVQLRKTGVWMIADLDRMLGEGEAEGPPRSSTLEGGVCNIWMGKAQVFSVCKYDCIQGTSSNAPIRQHHTLPSAISKFVIVHKIGLPHLVTAFINPPPTFRLAQLTKPRGTLDAVLASQPVLVFSVRFRGYTGTIGLKLREVILLHSRYLAYGSTRAPLKKYNRHSTCSIITHSMQITLQLAIVLSIATVRKAKEASTISSASYSNPKPKYLTRGRHFGQQYQLGYTPPPPPPPLSHLHKLRLAAVICYLLVSLRTLIKETSDASRSSAQYSEVTVNHESHSTTQTRASVDLNNQQRPANTNI